LPLLSLFPLTRQTNLQGQQLKHMPSLRFSKQILIRIVNKFS
jgi:hypothetical protein